MEVFVQGRSSESEVIRELLSPWDVTLRKDGRSDVDVVCGRKPAGGKRTLVIPSDTQDFAKWIEQARLNIASRAGKPVSVNAGSNTLLEVIPETLYVREDLLQSSHLDDIPLEIEVDASTVVLAIDIISEYHRILNKTFKARFSSTYNLLTRLPLPYNIAPRRVRNLLMKQRGQKRSVSLFQHLPLDALRFILLRALEKLCRQTLRKKHWKTNKDYACILTHDVDTQRGLQSAGPVKRLEEKYNVPSSWYIPSRSYPWHAQTLKELEHQGEIGSHDTVHDGRLIYSSGLELTERLSQSRSDLQEKADLNVEGFRAPLLQHSREMLQGIRCAGYSYDSSIPTWEPKHPRTMQPHGLGTVFPILLEGVVEIPVTVVQDHQLLYVLGSKPKEAIDQWFSMMNSIKALKGCCVFLSHPEYALLQKQNIALYEEILNTIASDKDAWPATAKLVAKEVR